MPVQRDGGGIVCLLLAEDTERQAPQNPAESRFCVVVELPRIANLLIALTRQRRYVGSPGAVTRQRPKSKRLAFFAREGRAVASSSVGLAWWNEPRLNTAPACEPRGTPRRRHTRINQVGQMAADAKLACRVKTELYPRCP